MDTVKYGLVLLTWGNVSAYDAETGYIVIKPSGVSYDAMKADDMEVVDLDGNRTDDGCNLTHSLSLSSFPYKNTKSSNRRCLSDLYIRPSKCKLFIRCLLFLCIYYTRQGYFLQHLSWSRLCGGRPKYQFIVGTF